MPAPDRQPGNADWPPVAPPHEFELDGETLRIRECPPLELLGIIADGNWLALVPGLLDDESMLRLWSWWEADDNHLDWAHVFPVATKLMSRIAGCDWWAASRILATARAHWMAFDAWCATKTFDPHAAPVYRTTAVAYAWLQEQQVDYSDSKQTEAALARLDTQIWTPPAWLTTTTAREPAAPWTPEDESNAFFAAMAESV